VPVNEAVERDARALCDAGDHGAAATLVLQAYGPELFGFLSALHADADDAADVFSETSLAIWRGLPEMAWRSSVRTWAYTIARNASHRFRSRARREVRLDDASEASRLAQQIRTATQPYLRTEIKTKFAELRRALPVEDQELLILRVDRNLAWSDLAQTLAGDGVTLEGAALTREAARLRKRFQALRDKLLELGRREGLLADHGTR
jgi:RNA polymerase sigma-70 factor (ECF subfamily)